jgi:hypothetical protein
MDIVSELLKYPLPIPDLPGVTGAVSALTLKGVLHALLGAVHYAGREDYDDGTYAIVTGHTTVEGSRTSAVRCDGAGRIVAVYAPDELGPVVSPHLAITALVEAMTQPDEAFELFEAYGALLDVWNSLGRRSPLWLAEDTRFAGAALSAASELYLWLCFGNNPEMDRLAGASVEVASSRPGTEDVTSRTDLVWAMQDVARLRPWPAPCLESSGEPEPDLWWVGVPEAMAYVEA